MKEVNGMYCRYREVSPVCMGKNRPLQPHEATKEHLIPKSALRDPRMKAKLGIRFNPSQRPNIDISCRRCNNLKNDLADVPFVWKLQYFGRHRINITSKSKLEKTVDWGRYRDLDPGQHEKILICLFKGDLKRVTKTACHLQYQKIEIKLEGRSIIEVLDHRHKLPRKQKKKRSTQTN